MKLRKAAADIQNNRCYILAENGALAGTACIAFGREPTYDRIYEGHWAAQTNCYGFLHRICHFSGPCGKVFETLRTRLIACEVFLSSN